MQQLWNESAPREKAGRVAVGVVRLLYAFEELLAQDAWAAALAAVVGHLHSRRI